MACIHSPKGIIPPLGDVQCPTDEQLIGLTGLIGGVDALSSKDGVHSMKISGREIVLKIDSELPKWLKVGVRVDIDLYRGIITKI